MIVHKLTGLKKKIEKYNTDFVLYPSVVRPPTIVIGLLDSFEQYTYVDQVSDNDTILFRSIPQSTTKITMLEGTTFLLKPNILDPANETNPTDISNLFYNWTKNDGPLYEINSLNNLRGTGSVMFANVARSVSGIYQLQVSNEYGTTLSDELEIDVIDPIKHPFFYKNLLLNPCGAKGTDNWTTDSDVITKSFASIGFKPNHWSINTKTITAPQKDYVQSNLFNEFRFQTSTNNTALIEWFEKAKQLDFSLEENSYWKWRLPEYHPNLVASENYADNCASFFPSPDYLDKVNNNTTHYPLKNYILDNNSYITRDKIKFSINGGKATSICYQDVDITDIRNIVDGEAYGINKLYLHFFAYIGVGITRYKTKYTTVGNESFEDNQIPVNYESYVSASTANEIAGEEVKPPIIPFVEYTPFTPYREDEIESIIEEFASKNLQSNKPVFQFYWQEDRPVDLNFNPTPNFDTGLSRNLLPYLSKILASGYWVGVVGTGTNIEKYGDNEFRLWFTKISDPSSVRTPDNKPIRLVAVPDWIQPYEPQTYSKINNGIKKRTALKLSSTEPFIVEPVVDDTTDVRLDFFDENDEILKSETIKGPDAKDIWAVKEKFFVPFYLANTYWWITTLTSQPIQVFNKTYTTVSAVRAIDNKVGNVDLNVSWLKAYYYPLFADRVKDVVNTRNIITDNGAAAMFGVSADIVVPVNTRRIRVNIVFNHLSNTIYDNNPEAKGWNRQDIYYDYLTSVDYDKRYYEYGMPRCGITAMNLSLHPNEVRVDYQSPTYKIPQGNVWYKHKRYMESDDLNNFNSISTSTNYNNNMNEVNNLTYRYNFIADDTSTSFVQRISPPQSELEDLITNESQSTIQNITTFEPVPIPVGTGLNPSIEPVGDGVFEEPSQSDEV